MWRCLCTILGTPSAPEDAKVLASLSFSSGGLGLASAFRVRRAAHFASRADSLQMVRKRHLHIAATMIRNLEAGTTPTFEVVRQCKDSVVAAGLEVPSWYDLSFPRVVELMELEPNQPKFGWQQQASRLLEKKFVADQLWPRWDNSQRALMRSQHGPLASAALTALPTSRATRIDAQPFRLLLCRRLHLPLPLSHRTCRCGRLLDQFGHHRAACSEAGVLGRRGFPLERAAAQICREGGARVTSNMFVRDMDLAAFDALDNRRLEVVADWLTLWRGAQLAIDTTMVSPLRRDGTARPRAANHDGAALEDARSRKGGHLPRTFWGRRESSPRGGSRSGREVERGNCAVPHRIGEASRRGGAVGSPRPGRGSMGATLERYLWRARLPEPSQCRCWTGVQSLAQARRSLQSMRF